MIGLPAASTVAELGVPATSAYPEIVGAETVSPTYLS